MPSLSGVETQSPTALATLLEDYFASRRASGISPRTLDTYSYPLKGVFLPFCAREGITEPGQVTQRVLDRLSTEMLDRGGVRGPLSRHSVHSYSKTINLFLNWCREQGELETRAAVQRPKLPRKLVDVLSRDEIQAMENAADNERDKVIVRLLADTGMRLSELLLLRLDDLVERDRARYVHLRGKGSMDRLVPVPRLYPRLKRFVERDRPKDLLTDRVLVGRRRQPGRLDFEPLTSSGVQQMLRVVARKAGLKKRVYPHLFRHSFITWCGQRNMHPVQIASIVGHSSLDLINDVYSHLAPVDANEAMIRLLQD